MINNFESNGAVKKMQSLKSSTNQSKILDQNNKDKCYKDRNVPNEYKFNFDSSSKFKINVETSANSDPENDQENINRNNPDNGLKICSNKSQLVFKSLNMNINESYLKSKNTNTNIMGNHYYSHGNSGAIKRGCEDVENENEDDLVTSISSSTSCSRRSPPKKPKFIVTSEEMNEYFNLLQQIEIQKFLERDACCLISDKYALAMVFTYFKRAKFNLQEYTKDNFYLALYLASDIEEDIEEYKYEIFPWALGTNWRSKFSGFLRKRDGLLRRIGYRAIVSRKCCEEVMSFKPEHTVWKRERADDHGGATRAYLINRSKKFLLNKSNIEDDELNLPRLPEESARPCPLCLINRGWDSINNNINLPEQKSKSISAKQDDSVYSSCEKYGLLKKQKNNDYSSKETSNKIKSEKVINTPLQSKSSIKDLDSNGSETESETTSNDAEFKKDSKMPSANKFLKNKLSTTELEQNHRGCPPQASHELKNLETDNSNFSFINIRHSSLVSEDKYVIKDSFNTSEEDEESSSEDDVFSAEKSTTTKSLIKKQEITRLNAVKLRVSKIAQQQNLPIRKRTNYSLNNTSNYNLRSHSVNAKNQQKVTNQIVPIE